MTTKNVPLEPTEAMLKAAQDVPGDYWNDADITRNIWAAMVEASPPSGGEVVADSSKELSPINAYICEWPDDSSIPRLMFFGDEEVQRYREKHKILPLYTSPRVVWLSPETLPKDGGTYLVKNDKGQVAPHIRGVIHNNAGSSWDWNYGESVTGWMHLQAALGEGK
jgi:hypothetical protein